VTWRWYYSSVPNRTRCIRYGTPTSGGTTRPTVVFVALPARTSPSSFGGIVGYDGVDITSSAVAGRIETSVAGCALCVPGTVTSRAGTLSVQGGGSLYATNADASAGTIAVGGSGGIFLTNDPTGTMFVGSTPVVTGQQVKDPFAAQAVPATTPPNRTKTTCGSDPDPAENVLDAGIYTSLTVTGNCSLSGGVYEFDDDVVIDAGTLTASNATLKLVNGASLVVHAGGVDLSGAAAGTSFVVWADDGGVTVDSGTVLLTGDVYVPGGAVTLTSGFLTVGGTVVAAGVDSSSSLTVQSAGTAVPQTGRPDVALVR
jgi:hypothetical protein